MADNFLYYGDNLDILRRYVKDESVDLVYLDPPFNSSANYNVLFAEKDGSRSSAQFKAFEDTWGWGIEAEGSYRGVVEHGGTPSQAMQAFRQLLGTNDMLAYLAMMAPRLMELHRVLKPTGSIYLHCDPTASHYLKMLMDAVFGPRYFMNEIIWKRTTAHNTASRRLGVITDSILVYTKSSQYTFHPPTQAHGKQYLDAFYRHVESDGRRYRLDKIERNAALGIRPNLIYDYKGYTPQYGWMMVREKLEAFDRQGKLVWNGKGRPLRKIYLDEVDAPKIANLWTDIPPIPASALERLGYPTQKPEALLERIIHASSNEGDVVLDPFCGCGTAVAAAQKLKRRWVGIDVTHIAITLIKSRLLDAFGSDIVKTYKVIGEPTTLSEAKALAEVDNDKYQFQWWSLGLVGARPVEQKKGADHGIDGRLYFHDDASGETKQVIFSVKGGHTDVSHVRDLRGVIDREKAQIGVLITLQDPPTGPMKAEAASAGFYDSPWDGKHPRLQILTIKDLLEGKRVDMPPLGQVNVTFKQAPRARPGKAQAGQ